MKYKIKKINLKNNSRLIAITGSGFDRAFFGIAVKAGFNDVGKEHFELPHLLEHLLLRDEAEKEEKPFSYLLEESGSYFNAQTENYLTKFTFLTAKDNISEVIGLALGKLLDFQIDEKDLKREVGVIEDELDNREMNAKRKIDLQFTKILTPWWQTPTERVSTLKRITVSDLLCFYKKNYTAANTCYVISGSFSDKEIESIVSQIENKAQKQPKGTAKRISYIHPSGYGQKIYALEDSVASKIYFSFGFVASHNFEMEKPEIKILYALLNDGLYSRLSRKLRQSGLSYGVNGGYSLDDDSSYFEVSSSASKEKFPKLFESVLNELKEISKGDFTDDELKRAKGYLLGDIESDFESALDLSRWYGNDFALGKELSDFNQFLKRIKEVERNDIVSASNKFLNKENWILILAGPKLKDIEKECQKIVGEYF